MESRAEEAHELTDFYTFCIFCLATYSFNDRVEGVRKVLYKQKCALFTRLAIRQQSQNCPIPWRQQQLQQFGVGSPALSPANSCEGQMGNG